MGFAAVLGSYRTQHTAPNTVQGAQTAQGAAVELAWEASGTAWPMRAVQASSSARTVSCQCGKDGLAERFQGVVGALVFYSDF